MVEEQTVAKQTINLGTSANKGDGDPLRTAFDKINDNFTEVYGLLGADEVDTDDVIAPMLVHNNHTNVTVTRDDDADEIIFTVDQAVTDLQGSVYGDDSTVLVDGVNSSINLDGTVKGDIIPDANEAYDIGSMTNKFRDLYLSGSTINLGGVEITNDSGVITFGGNKVVVEGGTGDVKGSIFGDDSTLLVDAVNSIIPKAVVQDSTNWDTAYSWGDHSTVGYLTSETSHADVVVDSDFASAGIMATDGAGTYSIVTDNSADWNTAFGWGDHAAAGYLTSETDSQTLSLIGTDLSITNGNTVDLSGFLTSYTETDPVVGAVTGIVKSDGAGNISAAIAGTDYSTFDGAYASLTGSPTALSDFSNDLDYASIVGNTIQTNGLPSGTTFTDTLTLPVLTAEPSSPVNGMVAVADGTSWDPMLNAAQTMVVYLAGAWRQIAQGGV